MTCRTVMTPLSPHLVDLCPPTLTTPLVLEHLAGSALVRALCLWQKQNRRPVVLVCDDLKKANSRLDQLHFFAGSENVSLLPPLDVLPFLGLSPHPDLIAKTMGVLQQLISGKAPDFIVTTPRALVRKTVSRQALKKLHFSLRSGDLIERQDLLHKLTSLGYERSPIVEEKGQFAVRGDIIDVYSPEAEGPVRITLFDIEVESLKFFNTSSQLTTNPVEEIHFFPVCEIPTALLHESSSGEFVELFHTNWSSELKRRSDALGLLKAKRDHAENLIKNGMRFHGINSLLSLFWKSTEHVLSFLPQNALLVHDLSNPFESEADKILAELNKAHLNCQNIEKVMTPEELMLSGEQLSQSLRSHTEMFHENFSVPASLNIKAQTWSGECSSNSALRTTIAARIASIHTLAPLASELNQKRLDGYQCLILCQNSMQLTRMEDLLKRFELPLTIFSANHAQQLVSQKYAWTEQLVGLIEANIHEGFLNQKSKEWWITDDEIFGKKTKRTPPRLQKTAVFSSFSDLNEGDYLIHMDHGIGLYRGLVKLDIDPHKNDFLLIEYLGGDRIYVPVDKLSRVQRFIAEEGATPQLDKLGGTTWQKTRDKAKRASRKLAGELLKLQAKRQSLTRQSFAAHADLCEEFAASFEFEETPDQLQAIEEVMRDLDRSQPMDRIICGDVGFGKTEVAMRAAFRAVADHKQVAVLVPTTVLAFQHYKTFTKRLAAYPVKVELLSRFRSAKEQNETLQQLKEGTVDVVIGTHRLLSSDVKFKNLGLTIIDEEHRFGVIHKEKLKKMRGLVDMLTLTATPIPRTLNLALTGIRDLSIINTPPVDRLAVKTFCSHFEDALVAEALRHELKRGGQCYIVHNRVQSLDRMTAQIARLVPEARIRSAHGQMDEEALEKIMLDFMNHEFDILVTTTIIESGLDIPNANTMIINRADTFGLSQLYQLRGRIGRSYHQAYCYLITPENDLMTDKARLRLIALQRHTELGSGFRIASHDLEIRGAGNILGDEQSGHIAAIGYDLYIRMLEDAIRDLKNETLIEDFDPEIQIAAAARIPDEFIPDKALRLTLYKQVSSAESDEEISHFAETWSNRFGVLPEEVENLFLLIRIRYLCKNLLVATLKQRGDLLQIGLHPNHKIDTAVLADAIKRNPKKFSLTRDGLFQIKQAFPVDRERLNYILDFLTKLGATVS